MADDLESTVPALTPADLRHRQHFADPVPRASDPKSLTFLNGNWQLPLAGVGVAGTGTITRLSPNVAVFLRFPARIQGKRGPNFLFRLLQSTCFAKKPLALPSGRARCVLHHRAE